MWKVKVQDNKNGMLFDVENNEYDVPENLGVVDEQTVQELQEQSENLEAPIFTLIETNDVTAGNYEYTNRKTILMEGSCIQMGRINFKNQTSNDYTHTYSWVVPYKLIPVVGTVVNTGVAGFNTTANRVFGTYARPTLTDCYFGIRRSAASGNVFNDTPIIFYAYGAV